MLYTEMQKNMSVLSSRSLIISVCFAIIFIKHFTINLFIKNRRLFLHISVIGISSFTQTKTYFSMYIQKCFISICVFKYNVCQNKNIVNYNYRFVSPWHFCASVYYRDCAGCRSHSNLSIVDFVCSDSCYGTKGVVKP